MSKYQIWSTLNPALWGYPDAPRVVGGTITKLMQGKRQLDPTKPLPTNTTLADFQWMRPTVKPVFQPKVRRVEGSKGNVYLIKTRPDGKEECSCPGYQYRRFCKHTGAK